MFGGSLFVTASDFSSNEPEKKEKKDKEPSEDVEESTETNTSGDNAIMVFQQPSAQWCLDPATSFDWVASKQDGTGKAVVTTTETHDTKFDPDVTIVPAIPHHVYPTKQNGQHFDDRTSELIKKSSDMKYEIWKLSRSGLPNIDAIYTVSSSISAIEKSENADDNDRSREGVIKRKFVIKKSNSNMMFDIYPKIIDNSYFIKYIDEAYKNYSKSKPYYEKIWIEFNSFGAIKIKDKLSKIGMKPTEENIKNINKTMGVSDALKQDDGIANIDVNISYLNFMGSINHTLLDNVDLIPKNLYDNPIEATIDLSKSTALNVDVYFCGDLNVVCELPRDRWRLFGSKEKTADPVQPAMTDWNASWNGVFALLCLEKNTTAKEVAKNRKDRYKKTNANNAFDKKSSKIRTEDKKVTQYYFTMSPYYHQGSMLGFETLKDKKSEYLVQTGRMEKLMSIGVVKYGTSIVLSSIVTAAFGAMMFALYSAFAATMTGMVTGSIYGAIPGTWAIGYTLRAVLSETTLNNISSSINNMIAAPSYYWIALPAAMKTTENVGKHILQENFISFRKVFTNLGPNALFRLFYNIARYAGLKMEDRVKIMLKNMILTVILNAFIYTISGKRKLLEPFYEKKRVTKRWLVYPAKNQMLVLDSVIENQTMSIKGAMLFLRTDGEPLHDSDIYVVRNVNEREKTKFEESKIQKFKHLGDWKNVFGGNTKSTTTDGDAIDDDDVLRENSRSSFSDSYDPTFDVSYESENEDETNNASEDEPVATYSGKITPDSSTLDNRTTAIAMNYEKMKTYGVKEHAKIERAATFVHLSEKYKKKYVKPMFDQLLTSTETPDTVDFYDRLNDTMRFYYEFVLKRYDFSYLRESSTVFWSQVKFKIGLDYEAISNVLRCYDELGTKKASFVALWTDRGSSESYEETYERPSKRSKTQEPIEENVALRSNTTDESYYVSKISDVWSDPIGLTLKEFAVLKNRTFVLDYEWIKKPNAESNVERIYVRKFDRRDGHFLNDAELSDRFSHLNTCGEDSLFGKNNKWYEPYFKMTTEFLDEFASYDSISEIIGRIEKSTPTQPEDNNNVAQIRPNPFKTNNDAFNDCVLGLLKKKQNAVPMFIDASDAQPTKISERISESEKIIDAAIDIFENVYDLFDALFEIVSDVKFIFDNLKLEELRKYENINVSTLITLVYRLNRTVVFPLIVWYFKRTVIDKTYEIPHKTMSEYMSKNETCLRMSEYANQEIELLSMHNDYMIGNKVERNVERNRRSESKMLGKTLNILESLVGRAGQSKNEPTVFFAVVSKFATGLSDPKNLEKTKQTMIDFENEFNVRNVSRACDLADSLVQQALVHHAKLGVIESVRSAASAYRLLRSHEILKKISNAAKSKRSAISKVESDVESIDRIKKYVNENVLSVSEINGDVETWDEDRIKCLTSWADFLHRNNVAVRTERLNAAMVVVMNHVKSKLRISKLCRSSSDFKMQLGSQYYWDRVRDVYAKYAKYVRSEKGAEISIPLRSSQPSRDPKHPRLKRRTDDHSKSDDGAERFRNDARAIVQKNDDSLASSNEPATSRYPDVLSLFRSSTNPSDALYGYVSYNLCKKLGFDFLKNTSARVFVKTTSKRTPPNEAKKKKDPKYETVRITDALSSLSLSDHAISFFETIKSSNDNRFLIDLMPSTTSLNASGGFRDKYVDALKQYVNKKRHHSRRVKWFKREHFDELFFSKRCDERVEKNASYGDGGFFSSVAYYEFIRDHLLGWFFLKNVIKNDETWIKFWNHLFVHLFEDQNFFVTANAAKNVEKQKMQETFYNEDASYIDASYLKQMIRVSDALLEFVRTYDRSRDRIKSTNKLEQRLFSTTPIHDRIYKAIDSLHRNATISTTIYNSSEHVRTTNSNDFTKHGVYVHSFSKTKQATKNSTSSAFTRFLHNFSIVNYVFALLHEDVSRQPTEFSCKSTLDAWYSALTEIFKYAFVLFKTTCCKYIIDHVYATALSKNKTSEAHIYQLYDDVLGSGDMLDYAVFGVHQSHKKYGLRCFLENIVSQHATFMRTVLKASSKPGTEFSTAIDETVLESFEIAVSDYVSYQLNAEKYALDFEKLLFDHKVIAEEMRNIRVAFKFDERIEKLKLGVKLVKVYREFDKQNTVAGLKEKNNVLRSMMRTYG
jgi:hypothetical protein